jgi:dimethylargininase
MFTKAITRAPGANYADGLTTVDLGMPDYQKTLDEYAHYLNALRQCGLTLTELPADWRYPDGTFVEDTAILLSESTYGPACAILTRPGAESRAGEVESMRATLAQFHAELGEILTPGTLDGGDICEAIGPTNRSHFFIGISLRTNEEGGRQLAEWLASKGFTSSFIDIRQTAGILHLKSGIAYLGDATRKSNHLVVIDSLAANPAFLGYELVRVMPGEEYAANCIRVNEHVLIAAGFPQFEASLRALGYQLIVLEMSEFQKMDGGLSCLSLRF